MPTATWNNAAIAQSDNVEELDGNAYFPPASLNRAHLEPSEHTTVCGWKGTARYYHVVVDGQRNENAAWSYPEPKSAAAAVKDHVAFWKGVQVG